MTQPFEIAPLAAEHAGAAHGLTTSVGWGHRREDWLLALSAGHGLGAFDASGSLRGVLMWFPYGARYAAVGMVAVDPLLHRAGIGRALMDRTIADAGDRTLLLIHGSRASAVPHPRLSRRRCQRRAYRHRRPGRICRRRCAGTRR